MTGHSRDETDETNEATDGGDGGATGRVLAVDLGDVRIGLAISDPDRRVATPLETLHVDDADDHRAIAASIAEVGEDRQATAYVIGLPKALSGREGRAAQRARDIAERLQRISGTGVAVWDERFTTVEAERVMIDADTGRRARRKAIDRVAATLILQSYLDSKSLGT